MGIVLARVPGARAADDPLAALPSDRYEVRTERCIGCGICRKVCRYGAIEVTDGKARIRQDLCVQCGACRKACPFKAIDLVQG